MEDKYRTKIELIQRSKSWYDFRNSHIGASDSPIICGMSPYKTVFQLWQEKTGAVEAKDISKEFHVQRGIRLESMINGKCCILLDRDFEDAVFTHGEREYISASLDGFDEASNEIIEIKTGAKKDHEKLFEADECVPGTRLVPIKYYAQLHQQMFVMNVDFIWYASYYLPKGADDQLGSLRVIKCHRDDNFIERYLPIAENFHLAVKNNTPPEPVTLTL